MLLKSRHLGHSTSAPLRVLHGAFLLLLCLAPALAMAGEKPKPDKAVAPGGGKLETLEELGLPNYVPPPSFHEDLVIHSKGWPDDHETLRGPRADPDRDVLAGSEFRDDRSRGRSRDDVHAHAR